MLQTTITTLENKTYNVASQIADVLASHKLAVVYHANYDASSGKPFVDTIKFTDGNHIDLRGRDGETEWLEYYVKGAMYPSTYRVSAAPKQQRSDCASVPTAPKAAPAKAKKLKPIADVIDAIYEQMEEEEAGGKIVTILKLYTMGYTRKEIVSAGFNKTTVYRQTGEYRKLQKAPALTYYGYELFELRVRKVMKAKGCNREKAVKLLMEKDLS